MNIADDMTDNDDATKNTENNEDLDEEFFLSLLDFESMDLDL